MRREALLLDEITAALDPGLVGEVEDVIQSLVTERITMVMVTHSIGLQVSTRFERESHVRNRSAGDSFWLKAIFRF